MSCWTGFRGPDSTQSCKIRLAPCRLPEQILEDFITRHVTTLKAISMSGVALDNETNEPTSWAKTLGHVDPIWLLDKFLLLLLYCEDILNVILLAQKMSSTQKNCSNAYLKLALMFSIASSRAWSLVILIW